MKKESGRKGQRKRKTSSYISKVKTMLIREGKLSVPTCKKDVKSAADAYQFLKHLENEDREHFVALHLNSRNQVIAIETASIGSLNNGILHPREVFKGAILNNSAAIIIAHNHPSGSTDPSKEDKWMSKRLKEVGEILGIEVLDHLIIGEGHFLSLKEKGFL